MSILLVIKGTPKTAEADARAYGVPVITQTAYSEKYANVYATTPAEFEDAVRDWFCTHVRVPFPTGALLWFRVLD